MQGQSTLMSGSTLLREILDEGDIEVKKIHTKENPADMLIKVIPEVKFKHCKKLFHIHPVA